MLFSLLILIASTYRFYQHRSLAARLALLPAISDSTLAISIDEPPPHLLLDLNSASAADLERLPGIGSVKAGRIIELRSRLGRFDSIDQLDQVEGIGPKIIERLTPFVFVGKSAADSLGR